MNRFSWNARNNIMSSFKCIHMCIYIFQVQDSLTKINLCIPHTLNSAVYFVMNSTWLLSWISGPKQTHRKDVCSY